MLTETVVCIIADFFFAAFPWLFIWNLKMKYKEKVIISASLSLGVMYVCPHPVHFPPVPLTVNPVPAQQASSAPSRSAASPPSTTLVRSPLTPPVHGHPLTPQQKTQSPSSSGPPSNSPSL